MTASITGNQEYHAAPEISDTQAHASETDGNKRGLSAAFAEHQADLAAGRFVRESVRQHMRRLMTPL